MTDQLVGYPVAGLGAEGRHPSEVDGAGVGMRVERLRAGSRNRTALEGRIIGAAPHVEAVLDVGTAANGDLVLVLSSLPARLVDLLEIPGWPTPGEAVTVLVPLLQALQQLHGAGVAHGAVRAAAVRFDERGAPVLCGFEHAVLRRSGATAFDAATEADRLAGAELTRGLLRATGARGAACAEGIAADPAATISALFAFAEPIPVRLAPHAALAAPPIGTSARTVPGRIDVAAAASPADVGTPRGPRAVVERLRPAFTRVRRVAGTVRPRIWVAAGASAALLLVALVLLPGRGADAVGAHPRSASPAVGAAAAAASSAPGRFRLGPVAPRSWTPARAATALLATRAACLAGSTASCLAEVDSAGSPVDVADRAALLAGVVAVLPEGGAARPVSFRGDTAVLDVHGVTVLAIREPVGWRLRDVIAKSQR